jgi:hypothetical protein
MAVGNLEFIKSVNGAGASSVSITDIFSADYDVYQIIYHVVSDSGSPKGVNLRFLDSSDSAITNTNYDYAYLQVESDGNSNEYKNTGQDKMTDILGYTDFTPEGCSGNFYVFNSFSSSSYSFITQQSSVAWNNARASFKGIGVLKETTSCTGVNIFLSSTNITSASKFAVYGLASN